VLVLAVLQGLNYREIARVLHVPVGTVKSRVFNALATLRRIYHEKDAR
jgi:DNA-directed RNA polymerase specialized sigma24 family protein